MPGLKFLGIIVTQAFWNLLKIASLSPILAEILNQTTSQYDFIYMIAAW